jgi:DNA invertase Pin-like site-specific DNA recombinase
MKTRAGIYARQSPDCSTSDKEQIDILRAIAAERGWEVVSVFADRPSATKVGQDRRSGEAALTHAISSGAIDKVMVWSIDRIGRSLVELIGFLETCRKAGVSLWLDEQGLDTETSNGLTLGGMTAIMAHHLRQSRRDRILRGQAAARALSIKFGRPSLSKRKVEKAQELLAAGKGVRQSARLAGISPASVSRLKNSMARRRPASDARDRSHA